MTREMLIRLISQKMFLGIFLLIFTYCISYLINLILGFRILKKKVWLGSILPVAFIWALLNLFVKPLLPGILTIFFSTIPFVFLLKVFSKSKLTACFWVVFLILVLEIVGISLITSSLYSINKNSVAFLMTVPYGQMVGSILEVVFPVMALLFLSVFDIPLIPTVETLNSVGFINIFLFGTLLFWIFKASINLYSFFANNVGANLMAVMGEEAVAASTIVGFCIYQVNLRKKHANQQRIHEELITENNDLKAKINQMQGSGNVMAIMKKYDLEIRDIDIMKFIAKGKSNKEIGAELFITESGVKTAVGKIFDRLGVENREEVAAFVGRNRLDEG